MGDIFICDCSTTPLTKEEMENQNKSAEFWIKNLNLVEHPEHKDGYFAVPFEDDFKVLNKNKAKRPVASVHRDGVLSRWTACVNIHSGQGFSWTRQSQAHNP